MDKTKLEDLLTAMVRSDAETLHLIAGHPPCLRLQGNVVRSPEPALTPADLTELIRDFLFADHRTRLAQGHEVEVLYCSRGGVRFRTTILEQQTGLSIVMRRLPHEIPQLQELGLPELVSSFVSFQSGIVALAGFLGSGKTSTLAALVERMNQQCAVHIVTIEDPIEYLYGAGHALIHQREVGSHVPSFAAGIRDAITQGADVLVVGEIRDHETLVGVLDAAESGQLVLTTTNGSNIQSGIAALLGTCPPAERSRARHRLAGALKVMMSQTLLQKSHGNGRVPLVEILINNAQVADALREDRLVDLPVIMQKSRGLGMQTVDLALKNLLSRNLITVEEALYHAVDRDWVVARSGQRAPAMS